MTAPADPSGGPPPAIATPDRRLRVFVSSTLEELAAERRAVRDAVVRLRLSPVMFELGARPHPPRDLYRAYLAQSEVFVGVYGDRYGWVGPGMTISGLEDELELSAGMPRLLYVRTPAPARDPRLARLLERVQAEGGVSTTPYRDPEALGAQVADDLAVLLSERFTRAAPAPPGLAPGWLPTPPTPMVDRTAELATVTALLGDPAVRLVVLTGPGGIGKTRLALAAAAAAEPLRDGTWYVDLAGVRDPADVPGAVAEAVGVAAEGSRPLLELVADRLAGRRVLLVVDNLEQVASAAPGLATLLARCPRTQLLATSRTVLRLRGEHDVPIEPLGTPARGDVGPAAVTAAPAVELFVARARQADPSFGLTEATAGPVAELVRRLDGLPLAVELAAARVRTLPPRSLLARLDRALDRALDLGDPDVDVPDRQRTLRATIAWSHDLLDEPGRALLARLSVCADGCTLDTAEVIGADSGDLDVLETLSDLVGHSLVTPTDTGDGEPRFRMLELVRTYAAERLRERGEEQATRDRWARHLAGLGADAGAGLSGPAARLWRTRLDAETADLRAALRWAVATDRAELAVRLTAPLVRWWWARGLLPAMAELAEATAALPSAAGLAPDLAGRLSWARAALRIALGSPGAAAPLLDGVVAASRARDDAWPCTGGPVTWRGWPPAWRCWPRSPWRSGTTGRPPGSPGPPRPPAPAPGWRAGRRTRHWPTGCARLCARRSATTRRRGSGRPARRWAPGRRWTRHSRRSRTGSRRPADQPAAYCGRGAVPGWATVNRPTASSRPGWTGAGGPSTSPSGRPAGSVLRYPTARKAASAAGDRSSRRSASATG